MSTLFQKKKSSSSTQLQRRSSSKKSIRSNRTVEEEETSVSHIREDPPKPVKQINYRDELTFLFLNSMLDGIIQDREIVSLEDSLLSKVSDDVVTITIVYKESPDCEPSMIPLDGSKYPSTQSRNDNSNRLSKKDSYKDESFHEFDDNRRSSNPISEEKVDWLVETEGRHEKITFKNGNTYKGQTYAYLMHGYGIFRWSDGANYEGYFKNGYPDGYGKIVLPELSKYEGDFCKSYFHGKGTLNISTTSTVYRGSWKNGKKHGKGWLLYSANNSYDGEWVEDEKRGFGFRQYENGAKYKGQWFHNKPNGEGSMLWENNDYYVGDWIDNKPHGYGEYTWNIFFNRTFTFPFYNWYKGSWEDGLRTGAGLMNFGGESGAKLAGIWKNNLKHGPGIMVCGNGLIVQRNPLFENDKPVHMAKPEETTAAHEDGPDKEKSEGGSQRIEIVEEPLIYKNCYRKIVKDVNSKMAMKTFDDIILSKITKSGLNISETDFVKFKSTIKGNRNFCPLNIPIHTVSEEVNFEYYIDLIMEYYYKKSENMKKTRIINDDKSSRVSVTSIKRLQFFLTFRFIHHHQKLQQCS